MSRAKILLASLPIWLLVIWLSYGFVAAILDSNESESVRRGQALSRPVRQAIVVVVAVAVVAAYFGAKRLLGMRPAADNQDLFEMLRLPFADLPQQVRVGIRRVPIDTAQTDPSGPEIVNLVQQKVWPLLSADVFVCRNCGRRQSDFVATLGTVENVVELICADCAVASSLPR
jgi:hypothetical protein